MGTPVSVQGSKKAVTVGLCFLRVERMNTYDSIFWLLGKNQYARQANEVCIVRHKITPRGVE